MNSTTHSGTIAVKHYQNTQELKIEFPQVKHWQLIYHAPRGQSQPQAEALTKAIQKAGRADTTVYKIGELYYVPTHATISNPSPRCICLSYIGDNGPCPMHGLGH